MNREQAKEYLKLNCKPDLFLEKAKRKGYICPNCGSGSGEKGTGIEEQPDKPGYYKCFKCDLYGDIIELYKKAEKIDNDAEAFNALYELYEIEVDDQNQPKNKQNAQTQQHKHNNTNTTAQTQEEQPEEDFTAFFLEANKNLGKTDYHRGISLETLNRFKIGYVEQWRHPKAPKAPASPRLIIPTSKSSYLARDTRADIPEEQKQYSKSKVGKAQLFNIKALYTSDKPIFIVEGEIDALSIIDAGAEAIGLGSTSNKRKFIEILKDGLKEDKRPKKPLIAALDNDAAGKKANKELIDDLKELNIDCYNFDISSPYKDANEALNANREAFIARIRELAEVDHMEELERKEKVEQLQREAAAYSLQDFINDINDSEKNKPVPTGFSNLDKLLDGGLYSGLYFVGAISSLGKTTFCLQMADQIAAAGTDVIIFSLEMAKKELMAKSVSRLTLKRDLELNRDTKNAKTIRGILSGAKYKYYNDTEKELIQTAIKEYSEYAKNIYIVEGMGDIGTEQIRERIERHIEIKGKAPVVIIDYTQIIAPAKDFKGTDKQNVDRIVTDLKRISRDFNIAIIGISSFNRDSYNEPVNLASFKESGAIEYSSDILIGLQYNGIDEINKLKDNDGKYLAGRSKADKVRELEKSNNEKAGKGQSIDIELKILKNRNGSKGNAIFDFYPMFNYFEPKEDKEKWKVISK